MTSVRTSYCDQCEGNTKHDILYHEKETWESEEVSGAVEHWFLKCRGCDHFSYRRESWNSEDVDFETGEAETDVKVYPRSPETRARPAWFSDLFWNFGLGFPLRKMLEQVYDAYDTERHWLAIMGVRAVIETVMLSKISDQGSFEKNLSEFSKLGFVTDAHRLALSAAIDKGSAAIHKGLMPKPQTSLAAIQVAENMIEAVFIIPLKEQELKKP